MTELLAAERARLGQVKLYIDAYRRYVWPVNSVDDLRLAPFHVLAGESGVFTDREHSWHLDLCDQLVAAAPDFIKRTERRVVEVTDAASEQSACAWWEELTAAGGEGMVVKPLGFVVNGRKGIVQPGIKCRGRDYLRIIYGPEYADASQINRLRSRNLSRKRSPRDPRVRTRHRGARPIRAPRAALPNPRVRVRSARNGERAGRPTAIAGPPAALRVGGGGRRSVLSPESADWDGHDPVFDTVGVGSGV